MYITYNINSRRIERIDDNKIILDDKNFKMIDQDITFDDDISRNMDIYKVDDSENFYIDKTLVEEKHKQELRMKREPLLRAFDIYKSNLIVGAISLPEEEKKVVIDWYNLILELDEYSINNPPTAISRYIVEDL